MGNDNQNIPLEEWKLCQAVIAQLESAVYRRQGWFFALITALVVSLLKNEPLLTKQQFTVLSLGVVVVFFIAEVIQRVPLHRGIQRSRLIEAHLRREDKQYDGPKLSLSLGQGNSWKDFFSFFYKIRIWSPYVAIVIVILIVRCYAP